MNELLERAKRISEVMERWRGQELDYTKNHCALMVKDAVKALTKKDLYPTQAVGVEGFKENLKVLKKLGGVEAVLDAMFEPINPLEALAGDIVLFPSSDELPALGVGCGNGSVAAFIPIEGGPTICGIDFGLIAALKAWKVPLEA